MDRTLSGGATSDPLVRLVCRSSTKRTKVKKADLNPSWQEPFVIPIDDPMAELEVIVEDWDRTSAADFMGSVVFPLTQFADKKIVRAWHPLCDEFGDEPDESNSLGSVELIVQWVYDKSFDRPPNEVCVRVLLRDREWRRSRGAALRVSCGSPRMSPGLANRSNPGWTVPSETDCAAERTSVRKSTIGRWTSTSQNCVSRRAALKTDFQGFV